MDIEGISYILITSGSKSLKYMFLRTIVRLLTIVNFFCKTLLYRDCWGHF